MAHRSHAPGVIFVLMLSAILLGCASAGPPMPPSLFLPRPPADLHATRKGNSVILSWTVPTQTTDREPVRRLGVTRVCRGLELPLSGCGTPVGESAPEQPATPSSASNSATAKTARPIATYSDPIPAEIQHSHPLQEAVYAVEVLNDAGRSAGLSNLVHVPLAPTLPPPTDFKAQVAPDGVLLAWSGVFEQQPSPGISHRYRIYRREQTDKNVALIAELPLTTDASNTYVDHTSDWEKNYSYALDIATVAGATGRPTVVIDGDDTPAVAVFTHDTFPPSVPSGLQAVYSGPGQQPFIDLIWAPVTNADLAGYNVYRSDSGAPATKVNGDIVRTPAYKDAAVTSGKQYTYWIAAVDVRGNESARSEPASEKVP